MKKEYFAILIIICLLLSIVSLPAHADGAGSASIPEGYATIDGIISEGEWDEAPKIAVTQACTADTKDKDCLPEESSLSFRAMWDTDCLYVLVEIEDDQLVINENNGTSYRNDSIFLYIGEDGASHSSYGNTTYMLCLFPYVNESDYDTFNENGKTGNIICRNGAHDVSGDKYVCVTTGDSENGYKSVLECAIMWDNFLPEVGESFAFDIQYNDSNSDLYGSTSNNREAIWSWNAVGSDFKGPNAHLDLMGTLEMIAAENPVQRPDDGDTDDGDTDSGNTDGENTDGDGGSTTTTTTTSPEATDPDTDADEGEKGGKDNDNSPVIPIVAGVAILILGATVIVIIVIRKKSTK